MKSSHCKEVCALRCRVIGGGRLIQAEELAGATVQAANLPKPEILCYNTKFPPKK